MLPYIPRDIGSPELQALHLLREGLPPEVWQFVPAPVAAPVDDYLLVPVDDAGIGEPLFQEGPILPEETNRLREQITHLNQIPRANEVPTQDNPVPQVPEVHQRVPRNFEVPLAPTGIQAKPPLVREDLLYERFRRMKTPAFEGPIDPIEADNWLIDIQVILDFMGLTEQEKVLYASFALKKDAQH
ncbi:hypothetical protein TIFTF001_031720 [Ficus carica]|uniref:Gag-pol polyprotein n=1 Tax=Ficus carica TaxID=3494 RepID=A0AA88J6Q0_FICCA|nr:hypothetical protein TIFTF001_031720 [Ficus carica]